MSPLGREMQKDVPSTKVIVPDPTGPAAVSAFHPAIPAPLRNQRPAPGLQRHTAARRRHVPSDATLACLRIPEGAFSHEPPRGGTDRQQVKVSIVDNHRRGPVGFLSCALM